MWHTVTWCLSYSLVSSRCVVSAILSLICEVASIQVCSPSVSTAYLRYFVGYPLKYCSKIALFILMLNKLLLYVFGNIFSCHITLVIVNWNCLCSLREEYFSSCFEWKSVISNLFLNFSCKESSAGNCCCSTKLASQISF